MPTADCHDTDEFLSRPICDSQRLPPRFPAGERQSRIGKIQTEQGVIARLYNNA
jgi:hypothetical protein